MRTSSAVHCGSLKTTDTRRLVELLICGDNYRIECKTSSLEHRKLILCAAEKVRGQLILIDGRKTRQ